MILDKIRKLLFPVELKTEIVEPDISICIPTLRRYYLLELLLNSLLESTVKPDYIYIVDNGGKYNLDIPELNIIVYRPNENLGVAASWNWFIDNAPEIRIIVNDDILFHPDAIQNLIRDYNNSVISFPDSLPGYSCFVLPDEVVWKVGYFDESISPNYAYFEDNDYSRRVMLSGCGTKIIPNVGVEHKGSSTKKSLNRNELKLHNRKYSEASMRYAKKWGGLPGKEKFRIPYNKCQ